MLNSFLQGVNRVEFCFLAFLKIKSSRSDQWEEAAKGSPFRSQSQFLSWQELGHKLQGRGVAGAKASPVHAPLKWGHNQESYEHSTLVHAAVCQPAWTPVKGNHLFSAKWLHDHMAEMREGICSPSQKVLWDNADQRESQTPGLLCFPRGLEMEVCRHLQGEVRQKQKSRLPGKGHGSRPGRRR